MRKIERIFVHCTAGSQKATVQDLWAEFKKKRWVNAGYHYVITSDGAIHQLMDLERISNGVQGYNRTAINVAYTGGIDSKGKSVDNRTDAQKKALRLLLKQLHKLYPSAKIMGHRDIWAKGKRKKDCPCFDAIPEYQDI